jgi:hypothetical protein
MNQPTFSVQPLESRCLLAGHSGGAIGEMINDPTIVADRQAVQDAAHQLITDQRAGRLTIRADQQAIRDELKQLADDKGQDAINEALQPLKDQLRADEKAKNKELRAAAADLRDAKRTWAKTLLADLKAWRQARVDGADQQAIDDAKAKLDADKKAAQDALKPIRDDILAIKDKWRPIITADHDAIQAKLESLDGDLKPLFDKLDSDADALSDKLAADQKALADAMDKLKADLDKLKGTTANA